MTLLAFLAGGPALADTSSGHMPPVDRDNPILQRFANDASFGPEVWVGFASDDPALIQGTEATFADFALQVGIADTGALIRQTQAMDGVGVAYLPPYVVILTGGVPSDYVGTCDGVYQCEALSNLVEGGAEVASLYSMYPLDVPSQEMHSLVINAAVLNQSTASTCSARLAVATLYTASIPEDFNFLHCAETIK